MHKLRLIGVSGHLGAGKDTVADYLQNEYGYTRVALADPIKRFGHKVFLFSREQLWGPSGARNAVDYRYNSPQMWNETEARLRSYGREFCAEVIGTEDSHLISNAYVSLLHWFSDLRRDFEKKLSPRIMLQTLGTEWGRDCIYEDVWIAYLLRIAKKLLNEDGSTAPWTYTPEDGVIPASEYAKGVVVSDVRFFNELRLMKTEGGLLVRVVRPETDSGARSIGIASHASEMQNFDLNEFDCLLNNNTTIESLYNAVDIFMRAVGASGDSNVGEY